jgi:hypothetical protein
MATRWWQYDNYYGYGKNGKWWSTVKFWGHHFQKKIENTHSWVNGMKSTRWLTCEKTSWLTMALLLCPLEMRADAPGLYPRDPLEINMFSSWIRGSNFANLSIFPDVYPVHSSSALVSTLNASVLKSPGWNSSWSRTLALDFRCSNELILCVWTTVPPPLNAMLSTVFGHTASRASDGNACWRWAFQFSSQSPSCRGRAHGHLSAVGKWCESDFIQADTWSPNEICILSLATGGLSISMIWLLRVCAWSAQWSWDVALPT